MTGYEVVLIVHILSWTSWMAGLFYLPRIYVYHAERGVHSKEASEIFKVMEQKLYKYIMTPAMVATWITGVYLAVNGGLLPYPPLWLSLKLLLLLAMTGLHHAFGAWGRLFANDANLRSGRFYRFANEAPTLLFVLIVILAVLQPM